MFISMKPEQDKLNVRCICIFTGLLVCSSVLQRLPCMYVCSCRLGLQCHTRKQLSRYKETEIVSQCSDTRASQQVLDGLESLGACGKVRAEGRPVNVILIFSLALARLLLTWESQTLRVCF